MTRKSRMATLMLPWLLILSTAANAAELSGVKMPDQDTVAGKTLVLNGLGARKATIFRVLVYVAGLYLEAKSSDAAAILKSPQLKVLRMHFKHDVSAEQLKEKWAESFKANCKADCAAHEKSTAAFFSQIKNVKDGDTMDFTFTPEGVFARIGETKLQPVKDPAFANLLLSTWIGDHPPSDDLKAGLLGKAQ